MATAPSRKYSYDYPRPGLTVDIVIVTLERPYQVLLIRRKNEPFAGKWALPGGYVEEMERLADAARRELQEETGIKAADLEQFYTAGDPGRDPRGWTVSVAYLARVAGDQVQPLAADDAEAAAWFPLDHLPELAFDHAMLLERARVRIADRSE